jgi:hypothetical protein
MAVVNSPAPYLGVRIGVGDCTRNTSRVGSNVVRRARSALLNAESGLAIFDDAGE